ncbi:hypothetical protein GCM10009858_32380 [Terrabacter carboxydivorans]|uniref:DUF3071 domain-containing protein n=2 Tax=Terrabacter carboxydivorans TaxID=619730 RepID=A0ABN3LWU7_9MICO
MHLLLADDEGSRFAVPLDEALRAAVRRDRPRLGQLQIEVSGGLRPKDVQAMIRAGLTAEEVAERAGWTVEKVHRYEGPILAEREHVAGLARQVRLRPRGGSHGGAPTLDARVSERLRTREIDAGSARWDSRRTDKGAWTVLLLFNAGGREREAAWQFDPLARTVSAVDDEARWLSEDEDQQAPGPIPAPHLAASNRPSRVYDVEAEGGVGASATRRRDGETVDLMAAMRERSAQRGRRRRPRSTEVPGLDEAPEEALPLDELAADPRDELPPPAHTHPEDDPDVVKTGTVEERVGVEAARRQARRTEPTQPVRQSAGQPAGSPSRPRPAGRESVADEPGRPDAEPEKLRSRGRADADDRIDVDGELDDDLDDDLDMDRDGDSAGLPASVDSNATQTDTFDHDDQDDADDSQSHDIDVHDRDAHADEHAGSPTAAVDPTSRRDRTHEDEARSARPQDTDRDTGRDSHPEPRESPDRSGDRAFDEDQPLRPAARRRPDQRPVSRIPAERGPGAAGVPATPRPGGSPGSTRSSTSFEQDGEDVVEQRVQPQRPKPTPRPAQPARKSGRPSVPSWDDIMFGRKND